MKIKMEKIELQFKQYLAGHGLKYTPERRRIFKEIFNSEGRFDAEQLILRFRATTKNVSRATVYRTLDLLLRLGIIRKLCFGERSSLYECVYNLKRNGHLVCIQCGRIEDFSLSEMEEHFANICGDHDFQPQFRCIQISGFCHACRQESPQPKLHKMESLQ